MLLKKSLKDLMLLALITSGLTVLVWLPHLLRLQFYGLNFQTGFDTIYRNFDGIEYIIIAKSWYFPNLISSLPQSLSANYYAAHFPGYALLIALFAPLLGYLKSMLFVSVLFTIFSVWAFYLLVKEFELTSKPFLLSLVFLLLPARWVIVHSVGSAEPIFAFFAIMTIYFFMKFEKQPRVEYIWLTGLAGVGAQLTRPPGILLFLALTGYLLWRISQLPSKAWLKQIGKTIMTYFPLLFIPLSLLAIFYWYSLAYGDFFAYFHSGDNIHLTFPPFQVFNKTQPWVGDIWLEDIIYTYIIGLAGFFFLLRKQLYAMAAFVLVFLIAIVSVAHRDISRYGLPIFPFIIIAFEKFLTTKEFKLVLFIILLGIYLYSQNFILANTAPYPNLEYFN